MNIAIVTGASSGMGREFALQLSGYVTVDEIWVIARRAAALDELAGEVSLRGIFVKKMLEKENAAPEEEKAIYRKALQLGLRAFVGEVKYNED